MHREHGAAVVSPMLFATYLSKLFLTPTLNTSPTAAVDSTGSAFSTCSARRLIIACSIHVCGYFQPPLEQLKAKLQAAWTMAISNCANPNEIADELYTKGVMTQHQMDNIQVERSSHKKVRLVMKAALASPTDHRFHMFINVLRKTSNAGLAAKIEGADPRQAPGSKRPTNPSGYEISLNQWREKLQTVWPVLVRTCTNPDEIADELFSRFLISMGQMEKVHEEEKTNQGKTLRVMKFAMVLSPADRFELFM